MNAWEARTYGLIQAHLDPTVPPLIRLLLLCGGPTPEDYERVRGYSRFLAEHGDALLFSDRKYTGKVMQMLVEALAVMAFCPGGVTVFGLHFAAAEGEKAKK